MTRFARALGIAVLLASTSAHGEQPALDCKIGPVTKTYGGTEWLVYSCDDARTVVVVSVEGSPAMPFYFIVNPQSEHPLYGEGTGNKAATDAAYADLSKLTDADVQALIQQTRVVQH